MVRKLSLNLTHVSETLIFEEKRKPRKKNLKGKTFFLQLNCVIKKEKFHVYFTSLILLVRLSRSLNERKASSSFLSVQTNEIYFCKEHFLRASFLFLSSLFLLHSLQLFFLIARNIYTTTET